MNVTIQLKPGELNGKILKKIQRIFKDDPIRIEVAQLNETEYLLVSEKNKKLLFEAIEQLNRGEKISVDLDQYVG